MTTIFKTIGLFSYMIIAMIIAARCLFGAQNYTLSPGNCATNQSCTECFINADKNGNCIALNYAKSNITSMSTKTCSYVSTAGSKSYCIDTGSVNEVQACSAGATFWIRGKAVNHQCNYTSNCTCGVKGGKTYTGNYLYAAATRM